jgi:hypothetical protein
MRKALLAILLIAASRPAFASGPPLTVPWPLDPYGRCSKWGRLSSARQR